MQIWSAQVASNTTRFSFPAESERNCWEKICERFDLFRPFGQEWSEIMLRREEPKIKPGIIEIGNTGVFAIPEDLKILLDSESDTSNLKFLPFDTDDGKYFGINTASSLLRLP